MNTLDLNQMELIKGEGCAGAVLGSLAVTIGAGALVLAAGSMTAGQSTWALAGWLALKVAATVSIIEDCAN